MGNYHARFLGGKGAARLLPYPVMYKLATSLFEILFLTKSQKEIYNKACT